MIEFAVVLIIKRKLADLTSVSTNEPVEKKDEKNCVSLSKSVSKVNTLFGQSKNNNSITDKIDFSCLLISLALYLLFNIVYFVYYINH